VAAAIRIIGATVLIKPVDKPSMILIPGPVSLALAMPSTGLCSEVKYSVIFPMKKPQAKPMIKAQKILSPTLPM